MVSSVASADQGIVYRQGARAALVGRPNAGKSSLLNALLRVDRAIVTPIPGTTRDTLEEIANLRGIPVVLIDTAGIAETDDVVERLGVARSRAALAAADLVLLVIDAAQPPAAADAEIAALVAEKPTIVVWNKIDLLEPANDERRTTNANDERHGDTETRRHGGTEARDAGSLSSPFSPSPVLPFSLADAVRVVKTSALTGAGIDELVQTVADMLLGGAAPTGERLISSPRHRDALARAAGHVRDALDGHARAVPAELLAVDLTAALTAIGEITGESLSEDLLAAIFSRFCIGK
jgi:tRNA modification GTPase